MLYRKYRPTTFADVTGQTHVVQTLQGALQSAEPGHAYLFTGPRGTGKTTLARLFAKALNCEQRTPKQTEPCNKCDSCMAIGGGASLDLIEIDAASNRGIDEIRNIKESAHVAAAAGNYKVFIIDEVHMLTTSAFNALLKTLEEPPPHVVFVLATTEAHKVLDTILSRVQRFDFNILTNDQITQKLNAIAKSEKLSIESDALNAIATYGAGSLRDGESALSKLVAYAGSKITANHVAEVLGIVSSEVHEALLNSLVARDAAGALQQLQALAEQGVHIEHFTKQFIAYLRDQLIDAIEAQDQEPTPQTLVAIINTFVEAKTQLKTTPVPTLPLELAIVEVCKA